MYKFDDFRPYLYKTSDYGKTWTKIVDGIPEGAFTRVVREDPVASRAPLRRHGDRASTSPSTTERAGSPSSETCPVVPVTDLTSRTDDLVVATQGRAFWILDDLTPLASVEREDRAERPSASFRRVRRTGIHGEARRTRTTRPGASAPIMPDGVLINYWLEETGKKTRS